jgi:polyhydroxyalkanoate synthesis regulator phasin
VAVPVLADTDGETSVVDRIKSALSGLVEDGSLTQEQADEVATTLSDAGLGHGGHHGGDRIGLETAAEALGLTEAELRTALEPDGTSLADVAQDQGVDVGTLVDALVQAQQDRIAQAVEDGRLTQAEADERLADLEARVTERVNSDDLIRGHHGRGGPADD